jgi:hypothetical protein
VSLIFHFVFLTIFSGSRTDRTAEPILMVDGLTRVFWRKEVPFEGVID